MCDIFLFILLGLIRVIIFYFIPSCINSSAALINVLIIQPSQIANNGKNAIFEYSVMYIGQCVAIIPSPIAPHKIHIIPSTMSSRICHPSWNGFLLDISIFSIF